MKIKTKTVVAIALAGICIPFICIQSRRGVSETRVNGQMDSDLAVDATVAAARKKGYASRKDLAVSPDGESSFIEPSRTGIAHLRQMPQYIKTHGVIDATGVTQSEAATESAPLNAKVDGATGPGGMSQGAAKPSSDIDTTAAGRKQATKKGGKEKPPKKKGLLAKVLGEGPGDASCSVGIFWPRMVCSYALYTPENCSTATIGQIRAELVGLTQQKLKPNGVLRWKGIKQRACEKALTQSTPPMKYPNNYREPLPLNGKIQEFFQGKNNQDFNNMKHIVKKEFKFYDAKMGSIPTSWENTPLANLMNSNIERKGHMCVEESATIQDAVVKSKLPSYAKEPKLTLSILEEPPDHKCLVKFYWYKSGIPLKMKTACDMTLRKMKSALQKTDRETIKKVGLSQNPPPFTEANFQEFNKTLDLDFNYYVVEDEPTGGHLQISNSSPLMDSPFHRAPSSKEGPPEIHHKKHRLYSGCGIEVLIKPTEDQGFVPPTDNPTDAAIMQTTERVKQEELNDGSEMINGNPAELADQEEGIDNDTCCGPKFAAEIDDTGTLVPMSSSPPSRKKKKA